jgi:hypothetical protein
MYETTADLNEDWYYARVDADMEQAEFERQAREARLDRANGICHHDGGYLFRHEAFYPEQVGLFPGEMHCTDCGQAVADERGPECFACGLDRYNCMGERGYGDNCKTPHDAFIMPPLVTVGYAPAGGF